MQRLDVRPAVMAPPGAYGLGGFHPPVMAALGAAVNTY